MFNPVGFITRYLLPDWLFFLIVILVALYIYGTATFNHFDGTGIKYPKPYPLFGNLPQFLSEGFRLDEAYSKTYGKTFGYFLGRTPAIVTCDPEVIREVCTKQFSHFINRNVEGFPIHKTMRGGLTVVKDGEWKAIRSAISPTFSSGKLKKMVPLIQDCAVNLLKNVEHSVERDDEFDFKDLAGTYTMDVICRTFFGVEVDSIVTEKQEDNLFVKHAKAIFNGFSFRDPKMLLLLAAPKLSPLFERLGISIFPSESLYFFKENIFHMLAMREKMENPPNDFLQLMLTSHVTDDVEETDKSMGQHDETEATNDAIQAWDVSKRALSRQEILGNSMIFLLAGYETTATSLGWLIYNLVLNQDVQERLYDEVKSSLEKFEGNITYDAVADCHYLDQCFNETLRMYPPAGRTDRICNTETELLDGKIKLKPGDAVHLSVWGTHYDPDFFPEPSTFNPDRFSTANKGNIVPYSFLPFGVGPRNCVGMRLAILETKIAVMTLVNKFRFVRSENTDVPPKYKTTSLTTPLNGIKIRAEKRKQ